MRIFSSVKKLPSRIFGIPTVFSVALHFPLRCATRPTLICAFIFVVGVASSFAQTVGEAKTSEAMALETSQQVTDFLRPCSELKRSDDGGEAKDIDSILAAGAFECGLLQVPEDPEDPEGRSIFLNVVRLPAVSSQGDSDPLFLLSGGPGEAATDLAPALRNLFGKVNRRRDIVLVDQRGTGDSNALDCKPPEKIDYGMSVDESYAAQERHLKKCLASYRDHADLRFYTTPYAVDDLNRVRKALGYQSINLWGGSYGTRVALVYARRHPESVRTITLDSVAPIGINLPFNVLADADQSLKNVLQFCSQSQKCNARFPDLLPRTKAFISELDASPRMIEVEHPLTQEKIKISLSGQMFASVLRLILYNRDIAPTLPLIIDSALQGDFRGFSVILTMSEQVSGSISVGMHQTVLCAADVSQGRDLDSSVSDSSLSDSYLQLDVIAASQRICEYWPKGNLPDNYFEAVKSDKPVLMLSGSLDPVTPPRWAETAGETLSNHLHVVVPGAHHGSTPLGCVGDLIAEFIEAGSHKELDTSCVNKIKPQMQFISPAGPAMSRDEDSSNNEPQIESAQN